MRRRLRRKTPKMFRWLNRLFRLAIVALWMGAGVWAWTQRERGWPLVDWWQSWSEANFQTPEPLPRMQATVIAFHPPGTIQVQSTNRALWNFGLAGLDPVEPKGVQAGPEALNRGKVLNQMMSELPGETATIAYTVATPMRTGLGFFYFGTNEPIHLRLARSGWFRINPEARKRLPLSEQVRLRAAEREARKNGVGYWASTPE